jgi:tRNA A-37 threonylcarbamoyl transferase component Bud32
MSNRVCPQCNQPLSSDAPQGLCPACLVKAAWPGQSALDPAETSLQESAPATGTTPAAGSHVQYFGDYELLGEIAHGGMGVVWKARQTSLHRDVALKMLRAGALARREEVERFLREAEAAANLQHPNIVAIHEVGEHAGRHYFSMDLVAGCDLGALVQRDGPLPPQRAARYLKIIAEAIHYAHQRGTLHRDLKPQNVLIDAADQPRITDFGLAKIMNADSRLTQSGVVMGSPSYMPPEQAAGRWGDIGPASDVYALGAMLYELLTGQPPFCGATPLATMQQVLESWPETPRRLRADIPVDLETICLKCLEKSPSARYPSARALADELERFLQGEPILARPAGPVRKVVSWAWRHPGILAAAASVVAVTLAFGAYYLYEQNAYLRAQRDDPTLGHLVYPHQKKLGDVLQPGAIMAEVAPLHDALEIARTINGVVLCAGMITWILVTTRARGRSFRALFDDAREAQQPIQLLRQGTRTAALWVGFGLVASAVALLVIGIQAHVWESDPIVPALVAIYPSIFFALMIFVALYQDYRLAQCGPTSQHGGPASRQLTPEQLEPIRRAMEDYDVLTAMKHYRDAVPDASLREADQYVRRLAERLRPEHPGKFVPPVLTLATLNFREMLICLLLEAAVVIVSCFFVSWSFSDAASFFAGFLFTTGLLAGARVQRMWQRLLLLTPGIGALCASAAVTLHWGEAIPGRAYFYGIVAGIILLSCGFTPRRGGQKPSAEGPRSS